MQVDLNNTFGAVMGWGAGIYWFFAGFKDLKARRIIENIPTSRIMTGAVGSDVEIQGRIICEKDKFVTAPISQAPCAFYSIEIQELRRRKNNTYWATIDQYFSDEGFYVDDDSGANALVLVEGARITRQGSDNQYRASSSQFSQLSGSLGDSLRTYASKLKKFRLDKTSWLFSREYRFLEWCFYAGETVYVLGFAESGIKQPPPRRKKLKAGDYNKVREAIRKDPKMITRFDLNKDGKLDFEELDRGTQIVAEKLLQKYSRKKLETLIPKTRMIFKNKPGHQFHISNMKETDLTKKIGQMSLLKIWGGPALTIACTLFLLFQFEIL